MSFRAKSYSKTIETSKDNPNYCRGKKIYFNPQLPNPQSPIPNPHSK